MLKNFLQPKHLHGVNAPHYKRNTEEFAAVQMPVPKKVWISMQQHMGAPCSPLVKKGDPVLVGQLIGSSPAFMSAPVYSSVSGTVTGLTEIINANSARAQCIEIETDGQQTLDPSVKPPEVHDHASFLEAVKASGLVGLGGAGFPTFIKLNPKNLDEVDTLVVNGAECEPYITTDYRTMLDHADNLFKGIALIQDYLNISQVRIGVETNKPKAIEHLKEKSKGLEGVEVVELNDRYPKGAEKVIAYETTGRVVPEGKLPSDAGLIVSNVTSVAFIARYIETGIPLIEKTMTVDGSAVAEPKNVTVLIGTSYADVIEFCGGYEAEPKLLISGGPMMGTAVLSDSYPVIKSNNALLAFDAVDEEALRQTACIRCGRCIRACPYNLMPANFESAYKTGNVQLLRKLKVNLCMECGCCSFVCPARRPLVETNRLSKKLLLSQKKREGLKDDR